MISKSFTLDVERSSRTGLDEAIFCANKTTDHITEIIHSLMQRNSRALFTRLSEVKFENIPQKFKIKLNYDRFSMTAILGTLVDPLTNPKIAIVSAGTSDLKVVAEVSRTLIYYGKGYLNINDVGVAGLWRLLEKIDDIRKMDLVIAVAGMDAALPTVLGGLIRSPIIGVPTSVGYGVADGGSTALNAMLASCSSGLTVVNIDNGYGAACAALKILGVAEPGSKLKEGDVL